MTRTLAHALLWTATLLGGQAALAQNQGFGLGIMVGDPTGLTAKGWLDRTHAVDGAIGWNTGDEERFHLHIDYLVHDFSLFKVNKGRLPFYYGIGGAFVQDDYDHRHSGYWHHHDDNRLGVRIPLGISYLFSTNPLELFVELAPRLDLTPDTDFTVDAGLGVRYYFK